jgi:hypothetical protein
MQGQVEESFRDRVVSLGVDSARQDFEEIVGQPFIDAVTVANVER